MGAILKQLILCFNNKDWNNGTLETGDPLAGTERSEASAKNTGILQKSECGVAELSLDKYK